MHADPHTSDESAIHDAAAKGDVSELVTLLAGPEVEPGELRRVFAEVAASVACEVVGALEESRAAEVLLILPPEQAASILAGIDATKAAGLLALLPSDERADLLAAMDDSHRKEVQDRLPPKLRAESARLLQFPPDTAGGLMETEFLAYTSGTTIRDVIRDLRANQQRYASLGVQYLYIVDQSRRLVGVAPMRDLLLAPEDAALESLPRRELTVVHPTATTQELADLFDTHPYQGVPVVDESGVLLGTVNRADTTESEQHQSEEQYRRSQGIVGGEELRSMPVGLRLRRRATWLGVNLLLCLGGAAVIALQQGTIAKALVVAAILPVISATSGNAAMQAAAVTIRELTLGVVDPAAWRRVLRHEAGLALLISMPLGAAVAGLAAIWGAPAVIGAAAGVAMAGNAVIAVGIGAVCPLLLRRLSVDPALAAGPITTTVADVTGFSMTLGLVSLVT